jgi:hypothetical protein
VAAVGDSPGKFRVISQEIFLSRKTQYSDRIIFRDPNPYMSSGGEDMLRFVCRTAIAVAAVLLIGSATYSAVPTTGTAPVIQIAGGDVPSGG